MTTAIPKQLPAVDCLVEETQCAKWSAAMTVGFYRPPAPCTVGRFFFKKGASHSLGCNDGSKCDVCNGQISFQIGTFKNQSRHDWTSLDIKCHNSSELTRTLSSLFFRTHLAVSSFFGIATCGRRVGGNQLCESRNVMLFEGNAFLLKVCHLCSLGST